MVGRREDSIRAVDTSPGSASHVIALQLLPPIILAAIALCDTKFTAYRDMMASDSVPVK